MVRLRDGDGADHELWAYSTGRPCVVQTRIADGVRSMVGYDCEIGPDCSDEAWTTFADVPPESTSCDAGAFGDELREGALVVAFLCRDEALQVHAFLASVGRGVPRGNPCRQPPIPACRGTCSAPAPAR